MVTGKDSGVPSVEYAPPLNQSVDQAHGRLMEGVHVAGYSFDRACRQLLWLLKHSRWKQCSPGFEHIDDFQATLDLSGFKFDRGRRKEIVRKLAALGAGQRATARALGVTQPTVARDVGNNRGETNVSLAENGAAPARDPGDAAETNVSPPPIIPASAEAPATIAPTDAAAHGAALVAGAISAHDLDDVGDAKVYSMQVWHCGKASTWRSADLDHVKACMRGWVKWVHGKKERLG